MIDNFLMFRYLHKRPKPQMFFGLLVSSFITLSTYSELRPFDSADTSLGSKRGTGNFCDLDLKCLKIFKFHKLNVIDIS
jgi:hypothetical protein